MNPERRSLKKFDLCFPLPLPPSGAAQLILLHGIECCCQCCFSGAASMIPWTWIDIVTNGLLSDSARHYGKLLSHYSGHFPSRIFYDDTHNQFKLESSTQKGNENSVICTSGWYLRHLLSWSHIIVVVDWVLTRPNRINRTILLQLSRHADYQWWVINVFFLHCLASFYMMNAFKIYAGNYRPRSSGRWR